MNKDIKHLVEAYEQVVANNDGSNFFEKKKQEMKSRFNNNDVYVFGITEEGKPYAIVEEYEKYDDGDRWYEETNYRYEVEGEKAVYVSDEKGKALKKKAYQEHPDLNKHIDPRYI